MIETLGADVLSILVSANAISLTALALLSNGKYARVTKNGKIKSYINKEDELIYKVELTLLEYLNTVSDLYIFSLTHNNTKFVSKYVSREVIENMTEELASKNVRDFGTDRYRRREWEILKIEDNIAVIRQYLLFKNIKLRKGIELAMASDIIEDWKVQQIEPYKFKVLSIT